MTETKLTAEQMHALQDVYAEAIGQWNGCDWTTEHGLTKLDLSGESPDALRRVAQKLEDGTATDDERDALPQPDDAIEVCQLDALYTQEEHDEAVEKTFRWWIDDLRTGADWLEDCESDAVSAEEAAKRAMNAIQAGRLDDAAIAAEEASSIESQYGDDPTWGTFYRLVSEYCGE